MNALIRCLAVRLPLLAAAGSPSWVAGADEVTGRASSPESQPVIPGKVTPAMYRDITERSPFIRTLSIKETYALRGVATLGGRPVATLYNRETKKTVLVTTGEKNAEGMEMVEVISPRELESVRVKVSFAGEIVELTYDADQITPPPPGSGRGGSGGRDYARPPEHIMNKYNSLNDEQRERYWRWAREFYDKNQDIRQSEERFPIIEKVMDSIRRGERLPDPGTPRQRLQEQLQNSSSNDSNSRSDRR